MREPDQLKLLEYANHVAFLSEKLTEADVNEYDNPLKELLLRRYEQHKANPEKAITGDELRAQLNAKYGWNF